GSPYTQQAISPSLPRGSASTNTATPLPTAPARPSGWVTPRTRPPAPRARPAVRIGQHRDRAGRHRVRAELRAVHARSGQGDVQVTGFHRPGVEGKPGQQTQLVRPNRGGQPDTEQRA